MFEIGGAWTIEFILNGSVPGTGSSGEISNSGGGLGAEHEDPLVESP